MRETKRKFCQIFIHLYSTDDDDDDEEEEKTDRTGVFT